MIYCARELQWHGYAEASRRAIERAINWYTSRPDSEQQIESRRVALAAAYYVGERFADARRIYAKLLKKDPQNINDQGYLGTIAARMGDTAEARQIDRILKSINRPYVFGNHTYWRARIASLLGEKEQAVALLRSALSQGVSYGRLHADVDLEPLREYPPFQELVKPQD